MPIPTPPKASVGRPITSAGASGPSYRMAEWLRENMTKRLKITQTELSAKLGYQRQTMISMMKMGKARVPLDKVAILAEALDVDVDFLMILALEQVFPDGQDILTRMLGKVVTEAEFALIRQLRDVVPPTTVPYTATQKRLVADVLRSPEAADLIDLDHATPRKSRRDAESK